MSPLFANGTIVDGSGREPFLADVRLEGERIAQIGQCLARGDAAVVDCHGLTLAPGFIDSHTHSDLQVLEGRREKLLQGVTAEVVGNCGFSACPPARPASALRNFANGIFCGSEHWGWSSTEDYLRAITYSPTAHALSLVGHGSLRIAVAGNRQGQLSETEVRSMESLLAEALAAGAAGFSTGLMYAPGANAPLEELRRLCTVTAKAGKIYTSHMRSYADGLLKAVQEQIALARHSGARLQISHLQAVGARNWPMQRRALELLEQARAEGIDVAFDCYPYTAGSSVLTQLLPQEALDGGLPALVQRLRDKTGRAAIREDILRSNPWRWSDIFISSVGSLANRSAIGRTLEELANARGQEPVDVALDLLLEEEGDAIMLCFNQSIENLRATLTHPMATIISDGFYVKGRPHPRLHGTFPLLLGAIARERGWLSLAEAVHKITAKPAERFGMQSRGQLAEGYIADIVGFRADTIDSPATYEQPELAPVGIEFVYRSGVRAM